MTRLSHNHAFARETGYLDYYLGWVWLHALGYPAVQGRISALLLTGGFSDFPRNRPQRVGSKLEGVRERRTSMPP